MVSVIVWEIAALQETAQDFLMQEFSKRICG
jgi:hypothetical protein